MEVILLEPVQNLGGLGDLVKVKAGYARNYLIPQGKAAPATAENRAKLEQHRQELEQAASGRLTTAQQRGEQMTGAQMVIARKVTEEGTLFGSVTTGDISEAMAALGFELAKSEIHLSEGPLKELGEHEVAVSVHPEVNFTITVRIVAEE